VAEVDRRELDELRSIEELANYQTEVRERMAALNEEFDGLPFSSEARDEYASLKETDKEIGPRIRELKAREDDMRVLVKDPARTESGDGGSSSVFQTRTERASQSRDIWDLSRVAAGNPETVGRELNDRARRAIELARFPHPDLKREEGQGHVERLLATDSPDGRFARYILATGSPTYKQAFGKRLAGQMLSHVEQAAMEQAAMAERALSLTGASGGFAVPFELDPTILPTSNGVVNPIRQIARVEQITVDEWRGISSTGITASYAAEATETTDNAPALVQPTISTEKAQAFVPFSIEIGMDWSGLQSQMAVLLQDAKDILEADKFVNGSGTNEPFGVLTGTTNTVNAGAGGTFTLANLYSLAGSLPPRYQPNATYIANLLLLNRIRQFETTAGSLSGVWQEGMQAGIPPRLLGKSIYEASAMPNASTVGLLFLLVGDFSRYVIVDRIGLTVETIPHLMGANRRPTGQRGIYAYWRNGAKVVDANAFRALIGMA
jgi:HK97 family phage major capsid protein